MSRPALQGEAQRGRARHELNMEKHKPYVADEAALREFTWPAVLMGAALGIVFVAR